MLIEEHFNITLRVFQLIGLAAVPLRNKSNPNFIPVMITGILGFVLAIYLICFPQFHAYSAIHTIINFASLIGYLLVIITGNCQCYIYRTRYHKIYHRLSQIEDRCRHKFLAKFPMKMAIHYRLKVSLIFFLFFISDGLALVGVLIESHGHSSLSTLLTSLLRSVFPFAILHVVLYSDLITMFIDEITTQIRNSPKNLHSSSKIELLKNVKMVHMDLWKLVCQLNTFFGWNLLVLIINSFIYITYQLYWIFLALQLSWHVLELIDGIATLSFGMVSLFVLVNSCQSGPLKIKYLVESIELHVFWTGDNVHLHNLKQEIFTQINQFPIYITGSDFFTIDRKYLAGITATCCMYIIICIQFFQTSDL